ncbi:hypothetical protein C8J57DRAFT_1527419 [Mycena rebaudengoi]|nr:hypothetical protein C8J57DRAFT_1527419 [Mycena rebaudengoi]
MDLNIISSLSSDLVLGREGLQLTFDALKTILLKINLIIATQPLSTSTRPNPVSTDQMMECPTVSVLISLVPVVPPHRLFL